MDPGPVFAWALDPARDDEDEDRLVDSFVALIREAGIPLARLSTSFRPLDPQVFARAVTWDGGLLSMLDRTRDITRAADYVGSTVEAIHSGSPAIRERLDPAHPSKFALLAELAKRGATDYLIQPIVLTKQVRTFIAYTGNRPGGFTDEQLAYLAAIHPAISSLVRLRSTRLTLASLARTYLGTNAAQRVLDGDVERGCGETIQAAIWFCDLRDFTLLSQALPADRLLKILDAYFETVAGPIADRGGEVLKFIGDAMLAIFPVATSAADACMRALDAAEAAIDRFAAHVAIPARAELGVDLGIGVSLHLGDVFYGNIGARDRLDFTVIGPAVNLAARVQGQCKPLDIPLLATADLVHHVARADLRSAGTHALKGIDTAPELFTLARFVRA